MGKAPHDCPGCGQPGVAYEKLSCRTCWFRLPKTLRKAVTSAAARASVYPAAHRAAVAEAIEWYRHNPLEVTGG